MLNVSRVLKNPGQVYPFEATVELEPMEYMADPLRFEDISVKGELLCAGDDRVSVTGEVRPGRAPAAPAVLSR